MWQRACRRADSRCVVATENTNKRRSNSLDDSRPPANENENGMNAAGSVMKAAANERKSDALSAPSFNARVVADWEPLL
jgi:hypothetical protein